LQSCAVLTTVLQANKLRYNSRVINTRRNWLSLHLTIADFLLYLALCSLFFHLSLWSSIHHRGQRSNIWEVPTGKKISTK